jgi:DNA-binding transcriptional MerR regulator
MKHHFIAEVCVMTIGQLAQKFGLSRSTLLHYDHIGLLTPSGRDDSNYRRYTDNDIKRLELVSNYREAGISLELIKQIISGKGNSVSRILTNRFRQIIDEINLLREQQHVIVELLKNSDAVKDNPIFGQEQWKSLFIDSGISEPTMKKWHTIFEKRSPEDHKQFLESLGISSREITKIRKWARKKDGK